MIQGLAGGEAKRPNQVGKEMIIETLARRLDMPRRQVRRVLDELFGHTGNGGSLAKPGLVQQWVAYGYEVTFPACCKFTKGRLKSRKTMNPNTGTEYEIPEKFRARAQILKPFSKHVDEVARLNMGDGP